MDVPLWTVPSRSLLGSSSETVSSKTPRYPFEEMLLLSNPKRADGSTKTEVNNK